MPGESYLWIKAIHVFGFILWTGAIIGVADSLRVRDLVETGREAATRLARRAAMAMDIGALLAIAAGVAMILQTRGLGEAWVMKQGFFHVKLTLVLLLLGLHVYLRIQVGKAKRGAGGRLPGAIPPLAVALILAVVIMAVARPIAA